MPHALPRMLRRPILSLAARTEIISTLVHCPASTAGLPTLPRRHSTNPIFTSLWGDVLQRNHKLCTQIVSESTCTCLTHRSI
ncbi:uncharacterized protein CC84DRAFT_1161092 [Paraphaeosphaeria sporulosa]|uniref:Uncharacterized protein n=1 Tax=Paraphaeosphaeria sporulosa TaxID=1460663 RepID=A0A177CRD4_9PLEO|nr:uncharacterized protein CC84DRAFT_1161092 [Paraphaeosphaeria sporulosa]OAG10083.1 hypothetical protein CC84DRAFT_1161092 [Paraphaeosphaeria sporulosa]